jgi:exopolysaccharide production protein ExoZ
MFERPRVDTPKTSFGSVIEDPVVEGLRGFAALVVMATHYRYLLTPETGFWGFGSTGVNLFFVLSGFVFGPYLFGKPLSLRAHLIRRFFRLYPLYFCALLLYVALRLPGDLAWDHFWVHLGMGHTLASLEIANFYNPAFWSLPPEVEYYLLLPLLAWLSGRPVFGRFGFLWLMLLAALMHLALVALVSADAGAVTPYSLATVHFPGLLVEFMLGSAAYAAVRRDTGQTAAVIRLVLGLLILTSMGLIFINFVAPLQGVTRNVPIWLGSNFGLGAALGYALVVSGLAAATQELSAQRTSQSSARPNVTSRSQSKALLQTVFIFCGELSYGVYLFHNAAPQILERVKPQVSGVAAVLACIGMTLLLAFAAHHAIEKPMRLFGRRLSQAFARSK